MAEDGENTAAADGEGGAAKPAPPQNPPSGFTEGEDLDLEAVYDIPVQNLCSFRENCNVYQRTPKDGTRCNY